MLLKHLVGLSINEGSESFFQVRLHFRSTKVGVYVFYVLDRRLPFLELFWNLSAGLAPWLEGILGHGCDFRRESKCHDPSLPESCCPAGIFRFSFDSWLHAHTLALVWLQRPLVTPQSPPLGKHLNRLWWSLKAKLAESIDWSYKNKAKQTKAK